MAVERQQAERIGTEFSDRIKQNPISQRFLRAGASIALAVAALAPDNVSTFIKPASAAESATTTIPTWAIRCWENAHLPDSGQKTSFSQAATKFLTFPETKQFVPIYQQWYSESTLSDLIKDLNSFYTRRMGIGISLEGNLPVVIDLPESLNTYQNDVSRFLSDTRSTPIIAQSTEGVLATEVNLYIVDPKTSSLTKASYLGSWGGPTGRIARVILPALVLNPNPSDYDKRLARRIIKHEYGHNVTKNMTDPKGQGHASDPKDIMYPVSDPDIPDEETYVSSADVDHVCLPGNPDPVFPPIDPKLDKRVFIAVVFANRQN